VNGYILFFVFIFFLIPLLYWIVKIEAKKSNVKENIFIISYFIFGAENQPINANIKNTIVVIHRDINPSLPKNEIGSLFLTLIALMIAKLAIKNVAITVIGTIKTFIYLNPFNILIFLTHGFAARGPNPQQPKVMSYIAPIHWKK